MFKISAFSKSRDLCEVQVLLRVNIVIRLFYLARKCADRLLCDMNLLLWVCAAFEPPEIDALQELLAMDLETGQVSIRRWFSFHLLATPCLTHTVETSVMDLFVYWAEWRVLICRECKDLMEHNDCIPYFC
jgi:hypothetical protein